MIILLGNQKGGVGKSTVACNLAALLADESKDVLILDADRQLTSSMWIAERRFSHEGYPKVKSVQKYGEIDEAILDLAARYQYVIIDAPGHDSIELRSAMTVCDILIMPFRPSNPDLATLPSINSIIRASKRVNPKIKPLAFINSAPTNSQGKDSSFARDAIKDYPEIKLLGTAWHDRRIFRDAMADGIGVIESQDKSDSASLGRAEVKQLLAEVMCHAFTK